MIEAPPPMSEPSPTTTPGHDPALDHRGAERAGVEVDEALVHHGGARGQVGAEPDPVRVGDPHPGGDHVVGHPGELVHPVHREVTAGGAFDDAQLVHPLRRARPGRGPGHVGQHAEDAVEVELVGAHQAVGEKVQPEVRVSGVLDRVVQRADHGDHLDRTQAGQRPVADRAGRQVEDVGLALPGTRGNSPSPSLPVGYQVSSTRSSAVIVARPMPQAASAVVTRMTVPCQSCRTR